MSFITNLKKVTAVAVATTMLALTGCSKSDKKASEVSKLTQSGNTIVVTLYPEYAPITVENFQKLAKQGFYDGLTFHRVVDDFMAQGGDPLGTGQGGSDETIKGEFANNGVNNPISHQRGVISMARSTEPNSASSQFFICYADCSFLDGDYAAFGNVTEGMEVVDDFMKVERDVNGFGEVAIPKTPIVMEKVEVIDPDENGLPRVKITMNDFIK